MTKRETIDLIRQLNATAHPDFLASFTQDDLLAYLHQLQELRREQRQHAEQDLALSA